MQRLMIIWGRPVTRGFSFPTAATSTGGVTTAGCKKNWATRETEGLQPEGLTRMRLKPGLLIILGRNKMGIMCGKILMMIRLKLKFISMGKYRKILGMMIFQP